MNKMKNIPVIWKAFLLNFIIAMIAIIPFAMMDHGYFAMTHDYSSEEIPYQIFMNQAVHSGELLWNWGIDLGGNVLEVFSFYNIGSPFTWLAWLVPTSAVVLCMPWILVLKFAVSGLTSALYLKRHLQSEKAILLGTMLYAFSGFQCASVVFYHFQDMVAFFPLMLVGLELLREEKKWGCLALACCLNVMSNYVFFVSEVVFLVIYYLVRYLTPELKEKKIQILPIMHCILEGAVGMMMAGVLLLPAVTSTMQNSRATATIPGEAFFSRSTMQWLQILKALILPGENMSRNSSISWADWMSNAAYLPFIGIVLVLIYLVQKKDWLSMMLKLFFLCAAFPLFNNMFQLFSAGEEYRRWYYMFILLMALASARVAEAVEEYPARKRGILYTACIYLLFAVMVCGIRWNDGTQNLVIRKTVFALELGMSVAGVLATLFLLHKKKELRQTLLCIGVAMYAVICLGFVIQDYRHCTDNSCQDFKLGTLSYGENTYDYITGITKDLEKNPYPYRYYFKEENFGATDELGYSYFNFAMAAQLPSMNSFISTAHPSITEFYDCLGIGRKTWTEAENNGSRELLSAKSILALKHLPEYDWLYDIELNNGLLVQVFDNPHAIPMGFSYDAYITREELMQWPRQVRARLMLQYLVVQEESVEAVSQVLAHGNPLEVSENWEDVDFRALADEKRMEASSSFTKDKNQFASTISCDDEKYVFYSVPYDKYWKASVNGTDREVINVCGLMAVKTDAGENQIVFRYEYSILKVGIMATILGFLLLIGLMVFGRRYDHESEGKNL